MFTKLNHIVIHLHIINCEKCNKKIRCNNIIFVDKDVKNRGFWVFGFYYCRNCDNSWESGYSYIKYAQKCRKCKKWKHPSVIKALSGDGDSNGKHKRNMCKACLAGVCGK